MDFVLVTRFSTRLEAETVGHALDAYGIPFVVKMDDAGGAYGGMQFGFPGGAALCVPEDRVEEVGKLLSCFVKPTKEPPARQG